MPTPHILFLGHLWPEPDSSAAGYRTMALINTCLEQNWQVSYASAAEETQWSVNLETLGVNCSSIKINDSSFDTWIGQLNPDFIIFDRFMTEEQFSWRVEKNCPQAITIIDTSDLHFLRRSRHQSLKKNKDIDLQNDDSIREISAIYRSDLSLIISSYELDLLKNNFNIDDELLLYLPFMFDQVNSQLFPPYQDRKNFFMIGNYLHEPNWDAVLWCKQSLWPKIRKSLPEIEIHIYGAYTPEKARQLHKPSEGFHIMGRAENLDHLIQKYRVNLVPLRFGAGIKGKVADGFRNALPCITTSIGAEGMAGNLPWGGFVCDNKESFIDSAINLYSNAELWQQKSDFSTGIINTIHNKETHQKKFIDRLLLLQNKIKKHRTQNFIGNMLKYHLHRSHEYMARWIEEKNSHPNE